jgi:secretion/DNA translocation related TadE-like protein
MNDSGAGTVLVVALVGGVCAVSLTLIPLSSVLVAKQRVQSAADASALAAADVAAGAAPGEPCVVAASVASGNGATLSKCVLDGLVATVRVRDTALGMTVSGTATAGPPPG